MTEKTTVIFSMKRYYMSGKEDPSPPRTTSAIIDGNLLHQRDYYLRIFLQTPLGAFLLSHGFIMKFVEFSLSIVDHTTFHIHLEPSLHIITDDQHLRYFNLPCQEIFQRDCRYGESEYKWMKEQVTNHQHSPEMIIELRGSSCYAQKFLE